MSTEGSEQSEADLEVMEESIETSEQSTETKEQSKIDKGESKLQHLLDELSKEIKEVKHTLNRGKQEIGEHSSILRARLEADSELAIEAIRDWSDKMRNEITESEKQSVDKISQSGAFNGLIEYTSRDKDWHPSMLGRLDNFDLGLDNLTHLTLFEEPKDDHTLFHCFINPYSSQYELIVLAKDSTGSFLAKLDQMGKITMKTPVDIKFDINRLQTLEQGFIWQESTYKYVGFDYNFNQIETQELSTTFLDYKFSASSDTVFYWQRSEDCYYKEPGYSINMATHELKPYDCVSDDCLVEYCYDLLASDRYLYMLSYSQIRVVEMPSQLVVNHLKAANFDLGYRHFSQVKILGDKYIAAYNMNGKVTLYSHDSQLDKLKEFIIQVPDKAEMSLDHSDRLCFFTSNGHIYHNIKIN